MQYFTYFMHNPIASSLSDTEQGHGCSSDDRGMLFYAYFITYIDVQIHSQFLILLSSTPHSFSFQTLQKIWLANHIKSIAELLHANAMQQLEVALLASPAAQVLNLLSTGVVQSTAASQKLMIHPPQVYTSTPKTPPPTSVPVVGLTSSSLPPVSSMGEMTVSVSPKVSPKHHCIIPTLLQSPESPPLSEPLPSSHDPPSPGPSAKSTSYHIVVVRKLAIPTKALPERINQPGGMKEYQCQICPFHHTNKDCILTHICKHLDITIGCPMCGKGF